MDLAETQQALPHNSASKERRSHATSTVQGWKRFAFLAAAGVFFILGIGGVILPGLPATPFLLLTSYFLARSFPELNQKLLESRVCGPILLDWQIHGGVRPHVKIKAVFVVLCSVGVTVYLNGFGSSSSIAVALLALVGVGVICRLPSTAAR